MNWTRAGLAALAVLGAAAAPDPAIVRTGIYQSVFQDTSRESVEASIQGFKELMEDKTGDRCQALTVKDLAKLGGDLAAGRLQFGVVHGFELAWLRAKHPDLKPLVVAINQLHSVRAHVMTAANDPARDLAALKGTVMSVPRRTKAYCRLYLDRECKRLGQPADQFFSRIDRPGNIEDSLDDVVDGKVQAALVDSVGLSRYKKRKPVRAAKLRQPAVSQLFPPSAVIYVPDAMSASMVRRFRDALLDLGGSPRGQEILREWKLSALEPVPKNYQQQLEATAKAYPPE